MSPHAVLAAAVAVKSAESLLRLVDYRLSLLVLVVGTGSALLWWGASRHSYQPPQRRWRLRRGYKPVHAIPQPSGAAVAVAVQDTTGEAATA